MSNIQITGGSEKQNAWASKIAQEWLEKMDYEISNVAERQDLETVQWYYDNLLIARQKLIDGLEKIGAKQLIDMYVAKRTPVEALIEQARKKSD